MMMTAVMFKRLSSHSSSSSSLSPCILFGCGHATAIHRQSSFSSNYLPRRWSRLASSSSQDHNPRAIPHAVDTLIVGSGPIGSSTAYHLAKKRIGNDGGRGPGSSSDPSILVIERDPTCNSGSAVFSAGGIRIQFSLKENVEMSLYGIDFLRQATTNLTLSRSSSLASSLHLDRNKSCPPVDVDIQYVENGYLFLASHEESARQLRQNHELYKQLGCGDMVDLLEPNDIASRFPWINVSDVTLGSHGVKGEGWFDPWTFIHSMNEKNKEMGVRYMNGTLVGATRDLETGKVLSVQIQQNGSSPSSTTTQTHSIDVGTVVNAAGAAADDALERLAGTREPLRHILPVRPRKRSIYFFHCDRDQLCDGHILPDMAPLTIDHTGAYFRSEGVGRGTGNFLCGISPPKDVDYDCYDREELRYADPNLFEDRIWPALYNRVPAFGSIKVKSSWAGLYEYNIVDQNCILDFHPEMSNVLMVNGFSGHGLQHSPAAGRAAAELIDDENKFQSLNLDIFRFDRIIDNKPVFERGIY